MRWLLVTGRWSQRHGGAPYLREFSFIRVFCFVCASISLQAQSVQCGSLRHYSFAYNRTDDMETIYVQVEGVRAQNGILVVAVRPSRLAFQYYKK